MNIELNKIVEKLANKQPVKYKKHKNGTYLCFGEVMVTKYPKKELYVIHIKDNEIYNNIGEFMPQKCLEDILFKINKKQENKVLFFDYKNIKKNNYWHIMGEVEIPKIIPYTGKIYKGSNAKIIKNKKNKLK